LWTIDYAHVDKRKNFCEKLWQRESPQKEAERMPKDFLGLPQCGLCGEMKNRKSTLEAGRHNTRQPLWKDNTTKKSKVLIHLSLSHLQIILIILQAGVGHP